MRDLKQPLTATGHGLMEDLLLAWLQEEFHPLQSYRFTGRAHKVQQPPQSISLGANEKEVYKLSIGAACKLQWPSEKIIIQILDDSTEPDIKELVWVECRRQGSRGINIKYEVRPNRKGYKLDPDFLWRTVPFFLRDNELALTQARWEFVNKDECTMTRIQEMSLNYHFTVDQEVGSSTYSFFGFSGTAGVWMLQPLYDAEGWKDRTTVEDMDLAVRASLKGWKFLFIGDVSVRS